MIETEFVPDELPRFGRFAATAELGAGAMGVVYRAHDEVLGRDVAIKTLNVRDNDGLRERFFHEARAVSALAHPNVIGIFDMGTRDGAPYLVMELAGGSLKQRLAGGALPVDEVRSLGIQVAHALAAAHAKRIVHRDVKPANILATSTGWKLADFGIARLPDSRLTTAGQFLGAPSYAAPEALARSEFTPAADVYGLGVTLYEALTGALPHGPLDLATMRRAGEQDAPRPSARAAVPPALDAAVARALSADPAKRPTAVELARLLSVEPEAEPVRAAAVVAAVAPPVTKSRVPRYAIFGAAAIAAIALLAAIAGDGPKHLAGASKPAESAESAESAPAAPAPAAPAAPAAQASPPDAHDAEALEEDEPLDEPLEEQEAFEPIDEEHEPRDRRRGRGKHKRKHRHW